MRGLISDIVDMFDYYWGEGTNAPIWYFVLLVAAVFLFFFGIIGILVLIAFYPVQVVAAFISICSGIITWAAWAALREFLRPDAEWKDRA